MAYLYPFVTTSHQIVNYQKKLSNVKLLKHEREDFPLGLKKFAQTEIDYFHLRTSAKKTTALTSRKKFNQGIAEYCKDRAGKTRLKAMSFVVRRFLKAL